MYQTRNINRWPERLYSLDVSRGLAALSVVLAHWNFFFCHEGHTINEVADERLPLFHWLEIFYMNGPYAVDYFFELSGFVFFWLYARAIHEKKVGFKSYAVNRFSRLYPLHFLMLLTIAILQQVYRYMFGGYYVYEHNDLYHFFLNIFFLHFSGLEHGFSYNAPVWSIAVGNVWEFAKKQK